MKDDKTTGSHYFTYTFLFERLGECTFYKLGSERVKSWIMILPSQPGTGEKKSTRRGGGSASATRSDVAGRREDRVEESDGGRKTSSEAGG